MIKFNRFSEFVLKQDHTREDEIQWMKLQGPFSSELLNYIRDNENSYDFFVFFTYLYCTTFFGLPLVANKAVLVPTAHDEIPIHLSIFKDLFRLPLAIINNTEEEQKFLNSEFKTASIPQDIVGTGIDVPGKIDPLAFELEYGLKNFIVFVGRIDESKGCKELFNYFIRFKNENAGSLKLVLLGKAVMEIPDHPDIFPLGFVSEQDKFNCIMASELLIMPSPFESLSLVLSEAWYCKKAVLVNGNCEVLKGQCIRSNGGIWYTNYEEFKECLEYLLNNQNIRTNLGENGKSFVNKYYCWEIIERKYYDMFKRLRQF
jgi:glycosyltransferase involved in cell wall biosynthesis